MTPKFKALIELKNLLFHGHKHRRHRHHHMQPYNLPRPLHHYRAERNASSHPPPLLHLHPPAPSPPPPHHLLLRVLKNPPQKRTDINQSDSHRKQSQLKPKSNTENEPCIESLKLNPNDVYTRVTVANKRESN